MNTLLPRRIFVLLILPLGQSATISTPAQAADKVDYQKQIRPILKERCYSCHGAEKREVGLRLDQRQEALAGGDSGPAIVPGDMTMGTLIERIATSDAERVMPPKGDRLTRKQVDLIKEWIEQGAVWPEE